MDALVALALSTPIWGFALQPPVAVPSVVPEQVAQVRTVVVDEEIPAGYEYDVDVRADAHNDAMMNWTRGLQVSTTVAMLITGALGIVQFYDEYGFHDEYSETACARGRGNAVFDYCGDSTPTPHLIGAAGSATALLGTIIFSTQVDYDLAARRDGDWRTYEVTRWIALALGLAQGLAGALLANWEKLEDPTEYANSFDLRQGFAVAHMALGVANVGMNVANSILIF